MFIYNKYHNWYFSIIEKAQSQPRKKLKKSDVNYVYYENHHILPKYMFPEYENLRIHKWNAVLLTPREHFICHWLLTKFVSETDHQYKMMNALSSMSALKDKRKLTSKQFEICRIAAHTYQKNKIFSEEHKQKIKDAKKNISPETRRKLSEAAKNISDDTRRKKSLAQMGKKHSEETKKKLSENMKGDKNPWFGKTRTLETRKKMSESQKGKKPTEDTKMKISKANKGRIVSSETRMKLSKKTKEYWEKIKSEN